MPRRPQAARDSRVRHPQLRGDQPGTPASPRTLRTDAVMDVGAAQGGLAVRRARMIVCPPARPAINLVGVAVSRSTHMGMVETGHASPGRGLATRQALLETELDELDLRRQRGTTWPPPTIRSRPPPRAVIFGRTTSSVSAPDASTHVRERPEARHLRARRRDSAATALANAAIDANSRSGVTSAGGRRCGAPAGSIVTPVDPHRGKPRSPRRRRDRGQQALGDMQQTDGGPRRVARPRPAARRNCGERAWTSRSPRRRGRWLTRHPVAPGNRRTRRHRHSRG